MFEVTKKVCRDIFIYVETLINSTITFLCPDIFALSQEKTNLVLMD